MHRALAITVSAVMLVIFSSDHAYATNYTSSIFADAQMHADSNSYKNANYGFSIQPPINWAAITNLPPSISKQAIVIFSNNDKGHLATFGIYHRNIAQDVVGAIYSHSDNDILATIAQDMSSNSSDSRTTVLDGIVDRYRDGVKVSIGSATQYAADNSTTMNENIIYFLNNGNQYILDLTSNADDIDKNSRLFEDSASTFFQSQTSPVPEFPIALVALAAAMFSIIFVSRTRFHKKQ